MGVMNWRSTEIVALGKSQPGSCWFPTLFVGDQHIVRPPDVTNACCLIGYSP